MTSRQRLALNRSGDGFVAYAPNDALNAEYEDVDEASR